MNENEVPGTNGAYRALTRKARDRIGRLRNTSFDLALNELKLVDPDDPICEIVARKIIEIGLDGLRNPQKIAALARKVAYVPDKRTIYRPTNLVSETLRMREEVRRARQASAMFLSEPSPDTFLGRKTHEPFSQDDE